MHSPKNVEMTKFYYRAKIVLEWVNSVLTLTLQITISIIVDN